MPINLRIQKINRFLVVWIVVAIGLFLLLLGYFFLPRFQALSPQGRRIVDDAFMEQERMAYRLAGTDPVPFQTLFDQDLQSGINDEWTKSHAYFIMNRYFNNRGNIYEIYNYVNSRPNLAFLQQASAIYPSIFQMISDRSLPATASPGSLLAYLAYLETLERNGYGGVALRGTAAHQYAKLAHIASQKPSVIDPGINVTQNILMKKNKALFFMEAAKGDVSLIFDGKADNIPVQDRVVGLSHYAAALRYLGSMGTDFSSPKTAHEIFSLCGELIRESKLYGLGPFTGLLDASTLLLDPESSTEEIRIALQPILRVRPAVSSKNVTIVRILESRVKNPAQSQELQLLMKSVRFGVFDKSNVVTLAQRVPEFRQWLVEAGWTDADFEL